MPINSGNTGSLTGTIQHFQNPQSGLGIPTGLGLSHQGALKMANQNTLAHELVSHTKDFNRDRDIQEPISGEVTLRREGLTLTRRYFFLEPHSRSEQRQLGHAAAWLPQFLLQWPQCSRFFHERSAPIGAPSAEPWNGAVTLLEQTPNPSTHPTTLGVLKASQTIITVIRH